MAAWVNSHESGQFARIVGTIPMAETPLQSELRRRMSEAGFNQKSLARAAKLNETAVRDILKGRSKNPRIDTLEALCRVLGCSVSELTGGGQAAPAIWTEAIDVMGSVGGGVPRKSVVRPTDDWYQVVAPKDPRLEGRPRFALEVEGDTASRFYRDGDLLICVRPEELNRDIEAGDRLIVQVGEDNREFQFVVGELQSDKDGQSWYWLGTGGDGRVIRSDTPGLDVIAVVVGSYRHE
jgi:transcriptional regulator with XRE-family HTH domain